MVALAGALLPRRVRLAVVQADAAAGLYRVGAVELVAVVRERQGAAPRREGAVRQPREAVEGAIHLGSAAGRQQQRQLEAQQPLQTWGQRAVFLHVTSSCPGHSSVQSCFLQVRQGLPEQPGHSDSTPHTPNSEQRREGLPYPYLKPSVMRLRLTSRDTLVGSLPRRHAASWQVMDFPRRSCNSILSSNVKWEYVMAPPLPPAKAMGEGA